MISLLTPHDRLLHVDQIRANWLDSLEIRGLLVDLDSTLLDDHATECPPRTVMWVRLMRKAGVRLCVVSNSGRPRVQSVTARVDADLPAVWDARKPGTSGFRAALRRLDLSARDVAVVGDQVFTDILGGRRLGARTILVKPTTANRADQMWMTRWKRPIERWVLGD